MFNEENRENRTAYILFLTAAMAAAVAGCSQKTTEVKDTSAAAVSRRGQAGGGDESVCGWQGEPGCRGEGEDFLFIAFYESGAAACQVLHGEAGGIPGG